jgi:cholest-4-en-3-one 26-monooxygenase
MTFAADESAESAMTVDLELRATELTDPETWRIGVPHDIFDAQRATDPIAWNEPASGGYWSLTRHADIAAVSKDHRNFTVTRGSFYPLPAPDVLESQQGMLLLMDPPDHTRLHKLVIKSFTPRVVAKFDDWIREVVHEVLDKVADRDSFDFITEVAGQIPGLVTAAILGISEAVDRQTVVRCADDIFSIDAPDGHDRHIRGQHDLAALVMRMLAEKGQNPNDDIISALNAVRASGDGQLSEIECVKYVALLTLAGFETTHTLLGQAMRLMLEDPRADAVIRETCAAGNVSDAVEELLRFVTPVNYFSRSANADVELGGKRISEGDVVVLWYTAGNRDPDVFDDPHRFIPARRPNRQMAFGGGGIHHCMGAHVARLEIKIFLEEFLRRGEHLVSGGPAVRRANMFVNQLAELPVHRG